MSEYKERVIITSCFSPCLLIFTAAAILCFIALVFVKMSTNCVYDYNDVVLNARSLRDQYAPFVSYDLFKCPDGCMSCTIAFWHRTLDIFIAVACPNCLKEWLVCSMCTNIHQHMMRNWYINRHLRDEHPEIQFDPKENKVRCLFWMLKIK